MEISAKPEDTSDADYIRAMALKQTLGLRIGEIIPEMQKHIDRLNDIADRLDSPLTVTQQEARLIYDKCQVEEKGFPGFTAFSPARLIEVIPEVLSREIVRDNKVNN
jgi:branched-subunit amino acid aminotransferase/4-amino-4-deoxychorismate lyase